MGGGTRLNVGTYHVAAAETNVIDWTPTLRSAGFTAVFDEARSAIAKHLEPFGVPPPSRLLPAHAEILISASARQAIFLRAAGAGAGRRNIDLMLVTPGALEELQRAVEEAIGKPLKKHTWYAARLVKQLRQRLGGLSPNGKHLANPEFREAARRLYDDTLRTKLTAIVSTFGENPTPLFAIQRLEYFKGDSDLLPGLLADQNLVCRRFVIQCRQCETAQLGFPERQIAEAVLKDAGRRCVICREDQLQVIETFVVAHSYRRGIEQGLWLESLGSDVLMSRTDSVWTGQMIEGNEIDVLGVFAGRTILVECKASSFGQNDLYITGVKADQLKAQLIVILTTEDIHPNVQDAMSRMGRSHQFRLISRPSAYEIKAELEGLLDNLAHEYLAGWLPQSSGPWSWGELDLDVFTTTIGRQLSSETTDSESE